MNQNIIYAEWKKTATCSQKRGGVNRDRRGG